MYDALAAGDLAAIQAQVDDGCVIDNHCALPAGRITVTYLNAVMGKLGLSKTDSAAVIGQIFSNIKDFKQEITGTNGNDDFAAVEWRSTGVLTAQHELLPKVAVGQTITAVGVGLYTVKNGLVVKEAIYGKWE
jgi:hypothetical protein